MLDIVGPYQVLGALPDAEMVFVAHEAGPVTDHTGVGQIVAGAAFDDVPPPRHCRGARRHGHH